MSQCYPRIQRPEATEEATLHVTLTDRTHKNDQLKYTALSVGRYTTNLCSSFVPDNNVNANMDASTGEKLETSFNPIAYLIDRYSNPESDTATSFGNFLLNCFHKFFMNYSPSPTTQDKVTLLDYGCGPVVCNIISASNHVSEITMAEYTPQSRILLEQWMKEGAMEKFDWTPHFKYIVQTLEGKTENEAKEREKELHQKLKNIISCNIKQDPHITSEYLGPYNILICALVLNITSTSVVDYEAQMKKLSSLVKRGGHFLFAASTLVDDSLDYRYDRYQFPGSDVSFTGITLSMRTLVRIMEKSGLTIISSSNHFYDTDRVWTFIAAIKA